MIHRSQSHRSFQNQVPVLAPAAAGHGSQGATAGARHFPFSSIKAGQKSQRAGGFPVTGSPHGKADRVVGHGPRGRHLPHQPMQPGEAFLSCGEVIRVVLNLPPPEGLPGELQGPVEQTQIASRIRGQPVEQSQPVDISAVQKQTARGAGQIESESWTVIGQSGLDAGHHQAGRQSGVFGLGRRLRRRRQFAFPLRRAPGEDEGAGSRGPRTSLQGRAWRSFAHGPLHMFQCTEVVPGAGFNDSQLKGCRSARIGRPGKRFGFGERLLRQSDLPLGSASPGQP